MEPQRFRFKGLLLDMDGTVIDTTPAIIKHWTAFGREVGVSPEVILATSHGRRAIDTIRLYDESKANWDYVKEAERKMPRLYPHDVKEIPGSRALIVAVREQQVPWAIVTSGTKPYAEEWFKLVSLPLPPVMVNAEDVEHGKPDPSCYTLACQRLALPLSAPMLVVEDSPAGIRAGKASGFTVLGLLTTHSLDEIRGAGADYIIKDLSDAKLLAEDAAKEEGFLIELRDTR